jgi:serine/threonine protein kinase/tetratricopeptide (TPR) repeat protein
MIGKTISHYKILSKLGEGGMGVVYKAEDTRLKRLIALKFLPIALTHDLEAKQRFIQEAQAASSLDHPNICTIYEIGETKDKQLFIAMAYYDGETLKRKLPGNQLSTTFAVDIARQIATGLAKAHEKGIVHRDIKPDNIMITSEGVVKILDFGLAKLVSQSLHTKTGSTPGTAAYMSPEQTQGQAVDHRTDIWSLGILMYEMLTGQRPFIAEFDQAIMYRVVNHEPQPISEVRPEVPEWLQLVVKKAMVKATQNRYQNMKDMLADLEEKKTPRSANSSAHEPQKPRRHKWWLPTAAALLLVCLGMYVFKYQWLQFFHSDRKTIAVISFENRTNDPAYDYLCDVIPNLLISKLEQSKYLRVTTWERLYDLLKQKSKANLSFIDPNLGLELCQMEGVQVIVSGGFNKTGNTFTIDAEVMDVADKTLIKRIAVKGNGKESILKTQIDELGRSIAQSIGFSESSLFKSQSTILDVTTSSMEAYKFYMRGKMDGDRWLFPDAQRSLEKAVLIDSNFASAYLMLGIVCSNRGNLRQAREANAKAKSLSYKVSEKEKLMIAAVSAESVDESYPLWQEMIKKYPKEKIPYLGSSSYFSVHGKYLEAIEEMKKALALDPNYGLAWAKMAYPYAALERYDEALECFKKYSAAFPGDADPYDSIAGLYFRTGRLEQAIANYQEALAINPDHFSVWKLAYVHALREEYAEAMKCLNQYLDKKAYIAYTHEVYLIKGLLDFWLGKYKDAIKDLQASEYLSNKSGYEYIADQSFWLSAWVYAAQSNYTMARKVYYGWAYRRSIKYPKNLFFYNTIINIYTGLVDLQQGRIDSAIFKASIVDSLLHSNEKANLSLKYRAKLYHAEVFLKKGMPQQAISCYETPPWTDVKGTGMSYNIVFDRNEPFVLDIQARAYQQNGHLDKAIGEYENLTNPDATKRNLLLVHPIYYYRMAKVYEQKGDSEKAIAGYQKFLRIWKDADKGLPEPGDARQRLAHLLKKR